MFVGFKRLKIQPFNAEGKANGDLIIIEGKQDEGATSTAEISGLSVTPTTVPGSDIVYYISRKGVGEVKVDFGILDFPLEAANRVLGKKTDETSKLTYTGADTEPPYCGVVLESTDAQGNKAEVGFFKGAFSRDSVSLKTLNPKETYTPEAESFTFTAAASTATDTDGQYTVEYAGPKDDEVFATLEKQVLGDPKSV